MAKITSKELENFNVKKSSHTEMLAILRQSMACQTKFWELFFEFYKSCPEEMKKPNTKLYSLACDFAALSHAGSYFDDALIEWFKDRARVEKDYPKEGTGPFDFNDFGVKL